MLAAIIKENDNSYYLHLEKENNINTISIIHSKKNKAKCLTEEEAITLLDTILSSELTYKEKYMDYDIYLDESNNKRFFKNGKEDFLMFFFNNGIEYIKYKSKGKHSKVRKFKIGVGQVTFLIVSGIAVALTIPKYRYMIIDPLYSKEIAIEDTENLISDSIYLSNENKKYLYNEVFINDVLEISNNNRNYSLREKLTNVDIEEYTKEDKPDAVGYYNSLEPSVIYIRDDLDPNDEESYYATLSHEFVHLLQNESSYLYIHEASAELMSSEYYNSKVTSYVPEVIRLKVLMEIIGPKPILECNFDEDDKSFEKAIKTYLSEEDANRLLELFKSTSDDFTDDEKEFKINEEVDALLATMYKNKTGYDIRTDRLINGIYQNDYSIKRCYFNQTRVEFSQDIELEKRRIDLGKTTIDEAVNSNEVVEYQYTDTKTCTEGEYVLLPMAELTSYDTMSIAYTPIVPVTINFENENKKYYIVEDNYYTQEEAVNEGFLEKRFILSRSKTVTDFNDIDLNHCNNLKLIYNDGSFGETSYNIKTKTWGSVIRYKIDYIKAPSIKEKFSDQFNKEESKNIEILDMYEEYVKNDKSEVKLI